MEVEHLASEGQLVETKNGAKRENTVQRKTPISDRVAL